MNPRQRIESLLRGEAADRPPFFPAIYDYKAALAGLPAHLFATDGTHLDAAFRAEVEQLAAEVLTSAYDIYNVEAEALGATLIRDPGIGMPEVAAPLFATAAEAADHFPDVAASSGRMGLFVEAARRAVGNYGDRLPVRGGITGPFSMASKVADRERLLMDTVMDPEPVAALLGKCNALARLYAAAFAEAGADVAVFDSFVAPPMMSPQVYRDTVFPFHLALFSDLRERGVRWRALIAGGNTLPLLPDFVKTGANQLLLDFNIPPGAVAQALDAYPEILFRVNLSPALLAGGTEADAARATEALLGPLKGRRNLILGTGILPPATPLKNILSARRSLERFYGG